MCAITLSAIPQGRESLDIFLPFPDKLGARKAGYEEAQ